MLEEKYKPEFEAKLTELGIREKFINNRKTPNWEYKDLESLRIKHLKFINAESWGSFINYSFLWKATPEGHDFWERISCK